MKQCIGLLLVLLLAGMAGRGQSLEVGQVVPDAAVQGVVNHRPAEIRLSDYAGKLVILDFWGTGCTACIKAFPKIEALQRQFAGKVQVVLVMQESTDSLQRFLRRMPRIKLPDVPCVTGDTVLHRFFPHVYVPHHVWMDGDRRVLAITDGYNATAKHIEEALEGGALRLRRKKEVWRTDYSKPLVAEADPELVKTPLYYSFLLPEVPALVSTSHFAPNRVTLNRMAVVQLLEIAFNQGLGDRFRYPNTLVLNVKDRFAYLFPPAEQVAGWQEKYAYYYELSVPMAMKDRLYRFMQQDLLRFFDLSARIETRPVKTLVLTATPAIGKLKTRGGEPSGSWAQPETGGVKTLVNRPFNWLTAYLAGQVESRLHLRFLNNTGYTGNIDISLSAGVLEDLDLPRLEQELAGYGLQLREELCPAEVLVISENQ